MRENWTIQRLGTGFALTVSCLLAACGSDDSSVETSALAPGADQHESSEPRRTAERVEDRVAVPDWFPADLWLPDDFEATQALKLPGSMWLLRGITAESSAMLAAAYGDRLSSAGYRVVQDRPEEDAHLLVFQGSRLGSSSLRIRDDGDRRELQFGLTIQKTDAGG